MNRSWITALTLAAVAGSGGAFAGVAAGTTDKPALAEPPAVVNPAAFLRVETQATPTQTISYQVGAAGTATLTVANGSLTVDTAVAGSGWVVSSASGSGTHADAQFTDGMQAVSFGADLVGNQILVSVTNAPVSALASASAEPIQVAVPRTTAPAHTTTTTQPQPAMPPSATAPTEAQPPATSATTAPSGSGGNDDGGSESHETESNDD